MWKKAYVTNLFGMKEIQKYIQDGALDSFLSHFQVWFEVSLML